jgi:hypothetical protein
MINDYSASSYLEYTGTDNWWLREVKGARVFDKIVFGLIKYTYLGARFFLRLILGRRKINRIYQKRNINFKDFLD